MPWCDAGWNGWFDPLSGNDAVLRVAAGLERDDARHVGLQREHLQVEHQLHVLGERVGHAGRRVGQRARFAAAVVRFDRLDAALDLAHVVQVAVEARLVADAEFLLHIGDFVRDINRLDGTGALYGPAPQSAFDEAQPADRLFVALAGRDTPVADADIEARLTKEIRFDPDLWVIEIEDRGGRNFLDNVVQ